MSNIYGVNLNKFELVSLKKKKKKLTWYNNMFMPSCHDRLTSVDAAGDNIHPTIPRYCFPSFPIPIKLEYHTEKRLREK